jgi:hypothetical protein
MLDVSPLFVLLVWVYVLVKIKRVKTIDLVVVLLLGYYLANTWVADAIGVAIGVLFAPKGG